MTKAQKLRTLLAIVECAPAASAMTVFESAARRGDLSAFWDHYQEVLGGSTPKRGVDGRRGRPVEGRVSRAEQK